MGKDSKPEEQRSESKIPSWLENASQTAVNKATGILNQPYQQYGGQMVADLTPDRMQAWDQVRAMQGGTDPAYQTAMGQIAGLQGSADPYYQASLGSLQGMLPSGPITAGQVTGAANQFMNPYNEQVVNRSLEALGRQGRIQQQQLAAQAGNVGAFGGERMGVAEGTLGGDISRHGADLTAQLQQQGWSNAMQNAMGMLQGNQATGMQAAQLMPGIAGQQMTQNAAMAQLNPALATQLQNNQMQASQLLAQTGQAQQAQQQNLLDAAYRQWQQKQGYDQQQLSNFIGNISGVPHGQISIGSGGGGGGSPLTGAIGGAASGAAAGSVLGPWGMAGGAVLGGVAGGLM